MTRSESSSAGSESTVIPIHQGASAGKSISDDDLCATCRNCDYRPGDTSTCYINWPGTADDDGYIIDCEAIDPSTV